MTRVSKILKIRVANRGSCRKESEFFDDDERGRQNYFLTSNTYYIYLQNVLYPNNAHADEV